MAIHAAEFLAVGKEYRSGWPGRRRIVAVRDASLAICPGEAVGLLGPNRAGKTTLVKLLLSLCSPTRGRVFRFGHPASDWRTLARVGYLHEHHVFPVYYTASQLLAYYGVMSRAAAAAGRIPQLLERFGLAEFAHTPIARLSKGMVQRLALAQTLVNQPDLLVLDEPNEGLDLEGKRLLREIVVEQKRRGGSVLLVSHAAAEAEKVCDRLAVMVEGRLVHVGAPATLTQVADGGRRPIENALHELYCSRATR